MIDTAATRKGEALRHLAANPPSVMIEDLRKKMLPDIPEEHKDKFQKFVKDLDGDGGMTIAIIDALVKHFTASEISGWTDFILSPAGRAITDKLADYTMELAPFMQAKMDRLVENIMGDLEENEQA